MRLRFQKMHGCGNDFLILDNFGGHLPDLSPDEVRFFCDRNFGIGADGLAVLQEGADADARWTFFNCDGSEAEMCGNAARCVIKFLSETHFPGERTIGLETLAGIIKGRIADDGLVEVTLLSERGDAFQVEEKVLEIHGETLQMFCLDTGVPHAVLEVKSLKGYPVEKIGSAILNHPAFAPAKTNVTFYQRTVGNRILSTTYERGVEKETFACGTGAAAAAMIFSEMYMETLPVEVVVPGGDLIVDVSPVTRYMLLRGPARLVATVEIDEIPANYKPPELYGNRKGTP